jgi:tetratricopeptide (TPR) repeat protein
LTCDLLAENPPDVSRNDFFYWYASGLADCARAIELDPRNADVHANRELIWMALGKHEMAIQDFSRVIELDSKTFSGYKFRGMARGKIGDHDAAIRDFTRAIELNPQKADCFSGRGFARLEKKDLDGAIADFTRAIDLAPLNFEALRGRGSAYYQKDELDSALSDVGEVIEWTLNDGTAFTIRGHCMLKRYMEAIGDYSKAIDLEPKNLSTPLFDLKSSPTPAGTRLESRASRKRASEHD